MAVGHVEHRTPRGTLDQLLEQNTKLTEQVEKLTAEIHRTVVT